MKAQDPRRGRIINNGSSLGLQGAIPRSLSIGVVPRAAGLKSHQRGFSSEAA